MKQKKPKPESKNRVKRAGKNQRDLKKNIAWKCGKTKAQRELHSLATGRTTVRHHVPENPVKPSKTQ